MEAEGSKECPCCGLELPLGAFNRDKKTKTGYESHCRKCRAVYKRKYRKERPFNSRAYHLRVKYGITEEDYQDMLAEQQGRCGICRELPSGGQGNKLHVDHCHNTGRVRGLLCTGCNVGLGVFKENPSSLQAAVVYLAA